MAREKARELLDELREVLTGRARLLDALVPPLVFVIANAWWELTAAAAAAFAVAVITVAARLARRQQIGYALGGVGGTTVAVLAAALTGRAENYFLPGILSGAATTLLILITLAARRPFVAWTSWVVRGWPLEWYWHPRVRPAYMEVSWLWAGFFGARSYLQWALVGKGSLGALAAARLLTGWPATVVLLVLSYLYGTWRLKRLAGPSVEEFRAQAPPPWRGQQRGF